MNTSTNPGVTEPSWKDYVPANAGCMKFGGHDPVWPKESTLPAKPTAFPVGELVDPTKPDGPRYFLVSLPDGQREVEVGEIATEPGVESYGLVSDLAAAEEEIGQRLPILP